MDDVATSDIVVITAGLRRKPDESRLDLINRNVDLFLALLDQVKTAGLKENAYLVVVSNPVDVLTYLAVQRSGLPWQRVIGLGTQLDTARFRSYLARRLQVPPTQVQALILGEHGDSMVPIWSSATVAGLPLEQWPGFNADRGRRRSSRRRRRPAPRSSSSRAAPASRVGLSIREVVHRPGPRQPPRPAGQHAAAGALRRARRVPVGADGGRLRRRPAADRTAADAEGTAGHPESARVLREIIDQVESRIGRHGPALPAGAARQCGPSEWPGDPEGCLASSARANEPTPSRRLLASRRGAAANIM